MTLENWQDILFSCLRANVFELITLIYLISWIFVGNYTLLNLFLAILLDGFESKDMEDEINLLADDIEIGANLDLNDPSLNSMSIGSMNQS
jgi:hypothetical protein